MKVKVFKLKEDYKIFKKGTVFQEINDCLVIENEWSRGVDRNYFDDMSIQKSFDILMDRQKSIDIQETLYFQVKMRKFNNDIDFQTRKLSALMKTKNDFLETFKIDPE